MVKRDKLGRFIKGGSSYAYYSKKYHKRFKEGHKKSGVKLSKWLKEHPETHSIAGKIAIAKYGKDHWRKIGKMVMEKHPNQRYEMGKKGGATRAKWFREHPEHQKRVGVLGGKAVQKKHPNISKNLGLWTKEHGDIISKNKKEWWGENPGVKPFQLKGIEKQTEKGFVSKPERRMKEWLETLAPDFIHGKHLGRVGVPDFHSTTRKKIIEVDGIYWHSLPQNVKRDKAKRAYWSKMGYTTFSFSDIEIMKQPEQTQQTLNNILGVHWIR